ncbi:MAG: FAD-dependent oxidoreductase [Actinomycetota bacterium]|nr:FAD-dependent oxidoreductase [Actinomycetota bacterium]
MRRYDVVVVGAGIMGSAAAWSLARTGAKTLLLDRFRIGHDRGSSHGSSRIFRLSYPDTDYVRMCQESLELWRRTEVDAGEELLVTTGGLDLGPGIEANHSALTKCGARSELLSAGELARRFTFLRHEGPGVFQPDSGFVRAERAWRTFARLAREQGADLREEIVVDGIEQSADGAVVGTAAGSIECSSCVVTAGAWARELLASAGIALDTRPTRETVSYFSYEGPPPPTIAEWVTPLRYALPAPGRGLKAGEHLAGPTADPNEAGKVDPDSIARIGEWLAALYPGVDPSPHHSETCLYTNTPAENFVLQRHGPVVVGSPCSGHGFKFAPLIGKRLAELALQ